MKIDPAAPVGTIFYTSWGYDQTNVEFYEVVSNTAHYVTVAAIYSARDGEQRLYPRKGAFIAPLKKIRRKCRYKPNGEYCIRLEDWGLYAWSWDGLAKSDTYTHGGAGH